MSFKSGSLKRLKQFFPLDVGWAFWVKLIQQGKLCPSAFGFGRWIRTGELGIEMIMGIGKRAESIGG